MTVRLGLIVATAALSIGNHASAGILTPPATACDGFVPPNFVSDGATFERGMFGLTPEVAYFTKRMDVEIGAEGAKGCDKALLSEQLRETYVVRRVNLLVARAVHRSALGETAGAAADLDLAAATLAASPDIYAQRSVAVSIQLVRAYMAHHAGDQAQAEILASDAWRARPYNTQVGVAALAAMGPAAGWEHVGPIVRSIGASSANFARLIEKTQAPGPLADTPALRTLLGALIGSDHSAAALAAIGSRSTRPDRARANPLTVLFRNLPDPEGPRRQPPYTVYQLLSLSMLVIPTEGGYREKDIPGGYRIWVSGPLASAGMVEEIALLRAAEKAKAAGKPGLIVVKGTTRSALGSSGSGMFTAYGPRGYDTEIDFRTVDALPQAGDPTGTWTIDVEQAFAALDPIYRTRKF